MHETLNEKPSSAVPASGSARDDTPAIMDRIRAFSADLEARYGTPEDIARRLVMRQHEHRDVSRDIREVERLLRYLLVIKADAIIDTLPPVKPRKPRESGSDSSPNTTLASAQSAGSCLHHEVGEVDRGAQRRETEGVSDGAEGAIWSGGPNRGANASEEVSREAAAEAEPRNMDTPIPPASAWVVSFALTRPKAEPRTGDNRYISRRQRYNQEWRERIARQEAAGMRKPYKPPFEPRRYAATMQLAMRYEASRRVIDNIEPYVVRTARRLQRLRERLATANYPEYLQVGPARRRRKRRGPPRKPRAPRENDPWPDPSRYRPRSDELKREGTALTARLVRRTRAVLRRRLDTG
jgi:hypothetical protein